MMSDIKEMISVVFHTFLKWLHDMDQNWSVKVADICAFEHIEAETKWLPFSKQHFQMHFF